MLLCRELLPVRRRSVTAPRLGPGAMDVDHFAASPVWCGEHSLCRFRHAKPLCKAGICLPQWRSVRQRTDPSWFTDR